MKIIGLLLIALSTCNVFLNPENIDVNVTVNITSPEIQDAITMGRCYVKLNNNIYDLNQINQKDCRY